MTEQSYDDVLRDAFELSDRGEAPTLDALRERHPGHDATVERAFAAFASYRSVQAAFARPVPAAVELLAPGERLGDFEIVELLDRGGMGVVYRARQLSLGGREVALKVLPTERAEHRTVLRFEREALAVADLHHRHLAEVHGFGAERGLLFLAMRLVDGPSLKRVLDERTAARERRDDPRERRAIVERLAEVADALALVHERKLVHRDVKPANIVLEGARDTRDALRVGSAVLIDFGLVRAIDSSDVTIGGDSPATPSYAAPEQLLGHEVDARSDVFSLGVTLHDLLAARQPQHRTQASAGLERIDALVAGIDADLAAIVAKAVDPAAQWRYADAAALERDLRAWLDGRPVSARRPSRLERARRWLAAHPLAIARALVLAIAIAVAAFAIAAASRLVADASSARAAYERSDVAALYGSLARVPAGLRGLLLRDRALVDLARRAVERSPSDPLARIVAELDGNDVSGALFEAATHLRVHGLASEPLAVRWLAQRLRDEAQRGAERVPMAVRATPASLVIARLLYERRLEGERELAASAPLRAALLDTFRSGGLNREQRLEVLTALAGCGRGEDCREVLDWALAQPLYSEEQRVAFMCVEDIVRRAHEQRAASVLDRADIWSRIQPLARRTLEVSEAQIPGYGWPLALRRLLIALTLTREGRADERTPDELFRPLFELVPASAEFAAWRSFLAAARDPRMAEWLARGFDDALNAELAAAWGESCSLYDDEAVTARARRRCLELASASHPGGDASAHAWVVAFDRGLRERQSALRGERPEMRPDVETLLGAALRPEDFPPLRVDRSSSLPADTDASWLVDGSGVHCAGAATGCRAELAREQVEPPSGFVWLGVFGRSTLDLDFELPAGNLPRDRFVRLYCQLGARPYYPFDGAAYVDVELDGEELVERFLMHSPSGREFYDLPLPADRLLHGANTITLRLHEATTTTLRFHAAEIRRRDW